MNLRKVIETHWYQKPDPILALILFPFSLLYEAIINIRKILFKFGIKSTTKLKVPVVIIGNISVGGAGKTPLTKYLAQELMNRGIEVGIILRGYKASNNKQPRLVKASDLSSEVGDEALIYAKAGLKVAIGSKRVKAGKLLIASYPQTQVILADDGMQHYYLDRDMEICVIDSTRIFGNQQLLPTGPLREPIERLKKVDSIVINGYHNQQKILATLERYQKPIVYQELDFECFYNPVTRQRVGKLDLNGNSIIAIAAIGNPYRFYNYLKELGVEFNKVRSFPDHYTYKEDDIPRGHIIITTEKDYTKLAQFNNDQIWVAMVSARLSDNMIVENIIALAQDSEVNA